MSQPEALIAHCGVSSAKIKIKIIINECIRIYSLNTLKRIDHYESRQLKNIFPLRYTGEQTEEGERQKLTQISRTFEILHNRVMVEIEGGGKAAGVHRPGSRIAIPVMEETCPRLLAT